MSSIRPTSRSKFAKSANTDDEDFKLTFDSVYKRFTSENRIDVFENMTRSEYRTKASKLPPELMKAKLKELKLRPKHVETDNLNVVIDDPFEIIGYDVKTPIQEKVVQHSNWMSMYGNYAYCCSCGAGKTLAGIYLIYKFQCRTLIISSRNAVNDQWFTLLSQLYPDLILQDKNGWHQRGKKLTKRKIDELVHEGYEPDIMVFSPQYLAKYVDTYKLTASLIIYDEVHALLSKEFIKVLLLPLYKVISGELPELPYLMALSATYPTEATVEGKESIKRLNKLFGSVFRMNSEVRRIPVNVWDYRDHFTREDRKTQTMLTGDDALGVFDNHYVPLDDCEAVDFFCQKIIDDHEIQLSKDYKGIIMTYSIDSSTYAALKAHQLFNCNVVLVRTADESCFFIERDKYMDFEFDNSITLTQLIDNKIGIKVNDYQSVVSDCELIVGTIQRLKEGFSVQNIVWGICTKFVFSTIARVQILGRIRRNSKNNALNSHRRIFYVCSGCVPTTIGIPNYRGHHKITYDFKGEVDLFKMENYRRI